MNRSNIRIVRGTGKITALEQFLDNRRRQRLLAQLARAAAAIDSDEAVTLVNEALPIDNEALELTEGCAQAKP